MKKIFLLAVFGSASLFKAQITFEKGYFISNSGKREEVLIRNIDWKNNPTEFEYKTGESSPVKKETINNIQEFGVDNDSRFIRKKVLIDTSSDELNAMSYDRKPEFKEETVFLKYVVDGKADLLYYENKDIRKFFFSIDDFDPKQLIYKPYYINNSQITYNEDYKKQLTDILTCGVTQQKIRAARYDRKNLADLFMNFNSCSEGNTAVNYSQPKEKTDLFNLNIRPGINFSSFEITTPAYTSMETTKFDNKMSFRIGIEAEFILPFNKNKWALFLEPTYQYYKDEKESIAFAGQYFEMKSTRSIDYKSLEIPVGARYYLFLNKNSKIFINAAYIVVVDMNSKIKMDLNYLDVKSSSNVLFGAGYKYKDKFILEVRATLPRTLVQNYSDITSKYHTTSLVLGYTLF